MVPGSRSTRMARGTYLLPVGNRAGLRCAASKGITDKAVPYAPFTAVSLEKILASDTKVSKQRCFSASEEGITACLVMANTQES